MTEDEERLPSEGGAAETKEAVEETAEKEEETTEEEEETAEEEDAPLPRGGAKPKAGKAWEMAGKEPGGRETTSANVGRTRGVRASERIVALSAAGTQGAEPEERE